MAGFSDYDWGYHGTTHRRGRRITPTPDLTPTTFTAIRQLERHFATDPAMVDRVRADLVAEAQRHMDTHGYTSSEISWEMNQPSDPMGVYVMRLDMSMVPRTDGEWPAIRAAIAEDEADRAEAARGAKVVNDRLDALAMAAAAWSNPSLRESFQAVGKAATGLSEALKRSSAQSFGRPSDR
jgi:hypothetical protein